VQSENVVPLTKFDLKRIELFKTLKNLLGELKVFEQEVIASISVRIESPEIYEQKENYLKKYYEGLKEKLNKIVKDEKSIKAGILFKGFSKSEKYQFQTENIEKLVNLDKFNFNQYYWFVFQSLHNKLNDIEKLAYSELTRIEEEFVRYLSVPLMAPNANSSIGELRHEFFKLNETSSLVPIQKLLLILGKSAPTAAEISTKVYETARNFPGQHDGLIEGSRQSHEFIYDKFILPLEREWILENWPGPQLDFSNYETLENVREALINEKIDLRKIKADSDYEWINKVLELPSLFSLFVKKWDRPNDMYPFEIQLLIQASSSIRKKNLKKLNEGEKDLIRKLNRYLIIYHFPNFFDHEKHRFFNNRSLEGFVAYQRSEIYKKARKFNSNPPKSQKKVNKKKPK